MAIQVSVASVSGNTVTINVTNTGSGSVTTRVRVGVTLVNGSQETLESGQITIGANQTQQVPLTASSTIDVISDDPEPF